MGVSSEGDVVFGGYFLKVFGFKAGDNRERGAPMLIGRIRNLNAPGNKQVGKSREAGLLTLLMIGGVVVCLVMMGVTLYRVLRRGPSRRMRLSSLSTDPSVNVEEWLEQGTIEEPTAPLDGAPRYVAGAHSNGHHGHDSPPFNSPG